MSPHKHLETDLRLMGGLLAVALGGNMVSDALWVLSEHTITSKVAQLSTYPHLLAALWMLCAALVIPYFLLQAFVTRSAKRRVIFTRLACWAVMAGGVLYAYMGYLSRALDYSYITEIFVGTALLNMSMAAVLAYGLNAAQRRAEDAAK